MKALLIGGAALLAVSPVLAQAGPDRQAPMGKVHVRADVQARVAQHFARMDTNRDGFVTREEAQSAQAAMHARMGQRMAQRMAKPMGGDHAGMFDRLDTNRDGSISRAEWDAMHRAGGHAHGGAQTMAHKRVQMHGGMMGLGGRMFDMADTNRDQRVSLQEATAMALRHFDMADANRDGRVTGEERMQMRQRMRGTHGGAHGSAHTGG